MKINFFASQNQILLKKDYHRDREHTAYKFKTQYYGKNICINIDIIKPYTVVCLDIQFKPKQDEKWLWISSSSYSQKKNYFLTFVNFYAEK